MHLTFFHFYVHSRLYNRGVRAKRKGALDAEELSEEKYVTPSLSFLLSPLLLLLSLSPSLSFLLSPLLI
jgi:hypothetical protein